MPVSSPFPLYHATRAACPVSLAGASPSSRSNGSRSRTAHYTLSRLGVFMLQWSPDLEDPGIRTPRRVPFPSASDRGKMSQEYEPSVRSEAADRSPAAMQSPSAPSGDGDAGPRDREPSPGSSEERAAAMFDRIAEYIEEVRTSIRIDVSDHVYTRCMAELRSLRERRFDRVTQSLENLRALIYELHARLVLVKDSRFASLEPSGQGRPERPNSARRPDDRTSHRRNSSVRSRTSPPSSTPPVGVPVTWNVPCPKGYPVPPR